jgi:threonine dehydratase
MAGVACAVKALKPACRVVGVELEAGPGMTVALAAGKPIPVARPQTWLLGKGWHRLGFLHLGERPRR